MHKNGKSESDIEELLTLRDAALQLGISFPTIKQWIYKKKIRSNPTAGGHHRVPAERSGQIAFKNPWQDRAATQGINPAREWS